MTYARSMPWLVLLAAAAFAAGPFLTPFDGFEAGDFPVPQENPLIQPPGWAFSIWGIIYPWLTIAAIAGATVRRTSAAWGAHRPWLFVALAVGAVWLPVSVWSPAWATLLIWIMLLTAIAALARTPRTDRWLLRVPVGLFAGWLTAASAVSLGIVGPGYDVAFSDRVWTVLAVCAAIFVALTVHVSQGRLPEYGLPIVWGLGAISYGALDRDMLIAGLAAFAVLIVIALMIFARHINDAVRDTNDPH